MKHLINVNLKRAEEKQYPIWIGTHLLKKIKQLLPKSPSTLVIITDRKVNLLLGKSIKENLTKLNTNVLLFAFAPSEKSKNANTKQKIEEKMLQHKVKRDALIIALGVVVVGDLAGFIAATYMRGIPFLQIPTTLLAMVDSSVGGKTGIDNVFGKNLIGAFWQPIGVIIDVNHLKTLSKKQMINGLIEALKMFLTHDAESFQYAFKHLKKILAFDDNVLITIIKKALIIKTNVVSQDEKELNQRMSLNFGHTIGHALEQASNYKILHGYAVAFGILVEIKIAVLLGFCDEKNFSLVETFFKQLGIDGAQLQKLDVKKIIEATKVDKKAKGNQVRYVLLKNIGDIYKKNNSFAYSVPTNIVK